MFEMSSHLLNYMVVWLTIENAWIDNTAKQIMVLLNLMDSETNSHHWIILLIFMIVTTTPITMSSLMNSVHFNQIMPVKKECHFGNQVYLLRLHTAAKCCWLYVFINILTTPDTPVVELHLLSSLSPEVPCGVAVFTVLQLFSCCICCFWLCWQHN